MSGQSKTEIRQLLDDAGLAPQHRFGQNFLIDLNLMRKFVAAANIAPGDVVLEVGPGTGSLTEMLLEAGAVVVACEIDRGLQQILAHRFANEPRFELVAEDALAGKNAIRPELLERLRAARERRIAAAPGAAPVIKMVANLPYQIATPLMMELLLRHPDVAELHVTIQKELGEKFWAAVEHEQYSPIAIVAQSLARIECITLLPAAAFWPAPKVESVMLSLRRFAAAPPEIADDPPAFAAFVRGAFQLRRKSLRRISRGWEVDAPDQLLAACEISPDARPEHVPVEKWRQLFALVAAARGKAGNAE